MTKTFEQQSRMDWTPTNDDGECDNIHLQIGCLQRIADATELMAKNHAELVQSKDTLRDMYRRAIAREDRLERSLSATRGHLTRLKNKMKSST